MCVSSTRAGLFKRSAFLSLAAAAALPLTVQPAEAEAAVLRPPAGMTGGNRRGAEIAAASPLLQRHYAMVQRLAASIGDPVLRADIADLLERPIPQYARAYPTPESRTALRDALAREGFVAANAPVSGIFPAGTEKQQVVQPFWSAPGSDYDSHHSYPGGLLAHELFNATMAANFERTYDALYFDGARGVNRDVVVAAALYHDIMKTVVFQFNDDGTLTPELSIGATGGHHCLSGAEAIVRGRDARFVTVLLSAHAAPSLGDEPKVVTWCRAAAAIAGVDPVEYGLVRKTAGGYTLAQLPPIETFVNHLSDHDYVLTVPAVTTLNPKLEAMGGRWGRHRILARASAVALYQDLTRGEAVFEAAARRALD